MLNCAKRVAAYGWQKTGKIYCEVYYYEKFWEKGKVLYFRIFIVEIFQLLTRFHPSMLNALEQKVLNVNKKFRLSSPSQSTCQYMHNFSIETQLSSNFSSFYSVHRV